MISTIWSRIVSLFTSKTASTTSTTSLDVIPGSSYAGAVTAVAGVTKTVIDDVNTPAMVQGRLNAEEQAERDRIIRDANNAISSGDSSGVDRDLS